MPTSPELLLESELGKISAARNRIWRFVPTVAIALLGISLPSQALADQQCPQDSYDISPDNAFEPPVRAAQTDLEISIIAPDGCAWTSISQSPFITVASGPRGVGNGTVLVRVAANPGGLRTGELTIAGVPFSVRQTGCISLLTNPTYSNLFPEYERHRLIDAAGGHRWLTFTMTSESCVGVPQSHVPWITVWGGGTGAGPRGSLLAARYTVEPNTSGIQRIGEFSIGYVRYSVTQLSTYPADVNGDGHADLLWHHSTTGHVATWLMNRVALVDGRLLSPGQVTDTGWKVVGSGDFIGFGQPDLVWQHDDGRVSVWWMNGTTLVDGRLLDSQMTDSNWRVRAVADFNGDGRSDLLFQHRTTGELTAWLMFQTGRLHVVTISPNAVADTSWEVVGAGDFDRDGRPDLVWQNRANGLISVWRMGWFEDQGRQGSGTLFNPGQVSDTNWRIRGVADIDRDGQPDLIWQNQANGLISTWLMHGINLREGRLFTPEQVADTNWVIVGPR